jgi:hypothetical protein
MQREAAQFACSCASSDSASLFLTRAKATRKIRGEQDSQATIPEHLWPTSGLPTILKVDGDKRVYEDSTHLLSLAKSR